MREFPWDDQQDSCGVKKISGIDMTNDIVNQFGHSVFYINVLIRIFYYLLEKRINTRILFLTTTYRRVLPGAEVTLMRTSTFEEGQLCERSTMGVGVI